VTNIGFNAFGSCNSLTNIAIPGSVTFLGTPAFANCIRLSGVYFGGNSLTGPQAISSSATVYYLPGTTGWSNSFGGRPTVLWNPAIQSDASFGLKSNQFGFNITGTANIVFVVDSCTSLVNPVWSPLQTVTLGSGLFYFSDALWTNYPGRFYRIRSP
jgi:hypothetical protein